uniref:Uncharacterized protein n=1 Tax=viral metagenome TaxID=1070528 RepID=A0A6C0KY68_9ZZZZ
MDPDELIFELFKEWYDLRLPRISDLNKYSEEKFANLWKNWWFAKREQQVLMDAYLEKYKPLFDYKDTYPDIPEGMKPEHQLMWKMGWIILWDQISRNVFRNSARAYETDARARKAVEELMPRWNSLPIPIQVSIILVYIHSEDIEDLKVVANLLEDIKKPMQNFPSVWISLTGIAKNHNDRMTMFGRIPERNRFLGRKSTEKEIMYMDSIYS